MSNFNITTEAQEIGFDFHVRVQEGQAIYTFKKPGKPDDTTAPEMRSAEEAVLWLTGYLAGMADQKAKVQSVC